jgi:hypothetical protein
MRKHELVCRAIFLKELIGRVLSKDEDVNIWIIWGLFLGIFLTDTKNKK